VIADLLGIPPHDREQFRGWSDAFMAEGQQHAACLDGMVEYFMSLIEKRRRSPRSDLLSTLIAACASGQRLSEREILGFCVLMVAGNETSSNLITNTFWCLD
jgi:cytochrome P450